MVNKLAEIEPRSSGETTVTNPDTGNDYFRPEQLRDTFILVNNLDVYAEVSIKATHSNDTNFTSALTNEQGIPLRPGNAREKAYTDSNELVKFIVDTPTAPSSGDLKIWREKDNTPLMLNHTRLNKFKELTEGRRYRTEFQSSLTDGGTITLGVRNPSDSDVNTFIDGDPIVTGGDALVTTEIDHGSYTDGTAVTTINAKPELQVERPVAAAITQDPTTSNPQKSMTGFRPGGTGANATGNRARTAEFELNPGQDVTIQLENTSSGSNRYGFVLDIIETVIR